MPTLATGLSTTNFPCFAPMQGRLYLTNDFDAMKVWDGVDSAARDVGITGPAAAPATALSAGVTDLGRHLIRYRYRNSKSLYVSNPSPSATVTTTAGNQTITLTTVASTDPKVDQIIVEMTAVNSPTYYVAAITTNTTTAVANITDANLSQQVNASAVYGDFEHEKPPLSLVCIPHRGRMFVAGSSTVTKTVSVTNGSPTVTGTGFSTQWAGRLIQVGTDTASYEISTATTTTLTLATNYAGTTNAAVNSVVYSKTPNRIYWSQALYPEAFKATARARDVLQGRSDELRGIASFGGDLWCFGRHSCDRLTYTTDPGVTEGQIIKIPGDRGVHNQRCLVEAEGVLYAWDRAGIYQVTGTAPAHLSKPVDVAIDELCDFDQSDEFHGGYDPVDRVLMWFFTPVGGTRPTYAVCMEKDTGRWFFSQWRQGITASALVPDSEGQVRLMLGDEYGWTWFYGIDCWDGAPQSAAVANTVSTGATTTSIPVVTFLPISPTLDGAMAYFPATGEAKAISTNTLSTLTLTSALSAAPSNGAEVWIGSIPWEYRSKWYVGKGMERSKRAIYLLLKMYPGSETGKLRVYIYKDFETTPMSLTTFSTDALPDGCAINMTGSYIEVDMDGGAGDGYVPIPMPADWVRALQVRLTSDKPDGALRIVGMEFTDKTSGVDTE